MKSRIFKKILKSNRAISISIFMAVNFFLYTSSPFIGGLFFLLMFSYFYADMVFRLEELKNAR